jgi:hypothetical protein
MLTIIEQRLTETSSPFNPEFKVMLKNNKEFTLHTL